MLKAIIIDDDPSSCVLISEFLEQFTPEISVVARESHLLPGIKRIKELKPHIVFLDVELPDGKGLELFQWFPEPDFAVIIITAHQHYILPSIPYRPHHLLLKPIDAIELFRAMQKIISKARQPNRLSPHNSHMDDKLLIKSQDKMHVLDKTDIARCEGGGSYTSIILRNSNRMMLSQSIGSLEKRLHYPAFIRVHQSHIINTSYIKVYDKSNNLIILTCNTSIPLSIRKRDLFIRYLNSIPSI